MSKKNFTHGAIELSGESDVLCSVPNELMQSVASDAECKEQRDNLADIERFR